MSNYARVIIDFNRAVNQVRVTTVGMYDLGGVESSFTYHSADKNRFLRASRSAILNFASAYSLKPKFTQMELINI